MRSIPWVQGLELRYADRGFTVVGIHSPESDFEKNRDRLADFLDKHEIGHPNLIDNKLAYWKKLNNRYWPAFYLVDRQGEIRYVHIGETHAGTKRAEEVELRIEALLQIGPAGDVPTDDQRGGRCRRGGIEHVRHALALDDVKIVD